MRLFSGNFADFKLGVDTSFLVDVDLVLIGCCLGTIVEVGRSGLAQNGSIALPGSLPSETMGAAVTGILRLRSVADGTDLIVLVFEFSKEIRLERLAPALAGRMFNVVINNGSTIAPDNQLIVDSFILLSSIKLDKQFLKRRFNNRLSINLCVDTHGLNLDVTLRVIWRTYLPVTFNR